MNRFGSKQKNDAQQDEQASTTTRQVLTKHIIHAVREHMPGLHNIDLARYTYERHSTNYPNSKFDVVIFDTKDKAIFNGREAQDGRMAIWYTDPV